MMEEKEVKERIKQGREFMHHHEREDFLSDQAMKKPQPPLVKERMSAFPAISLPKEFSSLAEDMDFLRILKERKSSRIFTQQGISLLQLSFLLWSTQGIRALRGKRYATLRTVPSGGARHPFETYLLIQRCEGLAQGLYHYLPWSHELEWIKEMPADPAVISRSLCGQSWAVKADVIFYWTCVPYRCEWRYGIFAHRVALMDLGHVGENLYLACSALKLGTCGVAAFEDDICNALLGVDGEEEFVVYTAPVGTISHEHQREEEAFYQFVKEEGL